jgi:hypothetical protein
MGTYPRDFRVALLVGSLITSFLMLGLGIGGMVWLMILSLHGHPHANDVEGAPGQNVSMVSLAGLVVLVAPWIPFLLFKPWKTSLYRLPDAARIPGTIIYGELEKVTDPGITLLAVDCGGLYRDGDDIVFASILNIRRCRVDAFSYSSDSRRLLLDFPGERIALIPLWMGQVWEYPFAEGGTRQWALTRLERMVAEPPTPGGRDRADAQMMAGMDAAAPMASGFPSAAPWPPSQPPPWQQSAPEQVGSPVNPDAHGGGDGGTAVATATVTYPGLETPAQRAQYLVDLDGVAARVRALSIRTVVIVVVAALALATLRNTHVIPDAVFRGIPFFPIAVFGGVIYNNLVTGRLRKDPRWCCPRCHFPLSMPKHLECLRVSGTCMTCNLVLIPERVR